MGHHKEYYKRSYFTDTAAVMSLNFSQICRLCMERDDTLVPLFEKGGYLLFRIKTLAPKLKVSFVFYLPVLFAVSLFYSFSNISIMTYLD
jgi:hypothetical protein